MTATYTNNCFPQQYFCSKLEKISNKRTKKALLLTNLQNMKN